MDKIDKTGECIAFWKLKFQRIFFNCGIDEIVYCIEAKEICVRINFRLVKINFRPYNKVSKRLCARVCFLISKIFCI